MIHHRSFWTGARWRTGGIFLYDESDGVNNKVTKDSVTKDKEKVIKEKNVKEEVGKKAAAKKAVSKKTVIKEDANEETVTRKNVMEISAARDKMLILLEQMQQKGVQLFVDGEAALPGEIATKAVCEGSTYMADYVLGENGVIEQVRFDRVIGR